MSTARQFEIYFHTISAADLLNIYLIKNIFKFCVNIFKVHNTPCQFLTAQCEVHHTPWCTNELWILRILSHTT